MKLTLALLLITSPAAGETFAEKAIHALWRPAFEKRQGTKSRAVGGGGAADAMGIRPRGEA